MLLQKYIIYTIVYYEKEFIHREWLMGYIIMLIKANQKVTALYKQEEEVKAHIFMNLLS